MRVAIYTRVSSEEQALNGYSLEAQKEKIEGFIKLQDGWVLNTKHIYSDEGISGVKPIEDRPSLKLLIEAAKKQEFDVVLVYKIDRFFRKTRFLLETVELLSKFNVGIRSITETFDTSNSMGRYMLSNLGSIAELERENIMERMALGRDKAAKCGTWIGGGVPFGYSLNKETKRLEINEEESKVVKLIYSLLVEGRQKAHEVQTKINSMNIPTRYDRVGVEKKSKTQNWWRKRTITRILTNSVYTGKFQYKRKIVPQRSDYQENLRTPEEIIIQDVPQIIDLDTWNKAGEILKLNKERSKRNTQKPYLFNQLISCGDCGQCWSAITREVKLKGGGLSIHKYYRCVSTMAGCNPYHCNQRQLREDVFENALWPEIVKILSEPKIAFAEIEKRIKSRYNIDQVQRDDDKTRSELEKEKAKLKRLNELYIEGALAKEDYDTQKQFIVLEIERLEAFQEGLATRLKELPKFRDFKAGAKLVYSRLLDRLQELKYEDKAYIFHQLVTRITYAFGEATVSLLLPSCQLQEGQGVCGII